MRKADPYKRDELLVKCYECFCKNGIEGTSTQKLAAACGMSSGNIFHYFKTKDEIIIDATAYSMAKVEDDFMAKAPKDFKDIQRFLHEIPYWTAEKHGEKYRFMYQVYTSPKYREHGKKFFEGVTERYTEYAKSLEPKIGIPWDILQSLIYVFVRASVHYALFEDENYLLPQIKLIDDVLPLLAKKIRRYATERKRINDRERYPVRVALVL